MTGMGDERTPCATHPLPSVVPPAGAVSPVPPHIQGAEWWTERRTRTTGNRWGLRVLVVGGLAGAAWLLTGAAAHAADRNDEPTGSLLGSVIGGDVTAPVSGLLDAATRPLEAVPAHHRHHVVTDILEVPQRALTRPVETLSEVTHGSSGTTVDTVSDGVDTVLREDAGPLRLTGGPVTTQQGLPAATDLVTADAEPAVERPQVPAITPVRAVSTQPQPAASVSHVRIPKALPAPIAVPRVGGPERIVKVASVAFAHRHPVARRGPAELAALSEDLPGGNGPAPLQVHLGDVSGIPASGSGTPPEGGSAAFLPTAIASSTMACHRLPIASDVEVRRTDAEAPTVSPD
jgi:hypothetical protein